MLAEALVALAGAGGTALVGAVATDGWQLAKRGFARLFGRDDPQRTAAADERLERTRALVERADPRDDRVRLEQRAAWAARLEDLLTEHPELADELRTLVEQVTTAAGNRSAGPVTQHAVAFDQAQQAVQGHGQQTNVFLRPGSSSGWADDHR